MNDGFYRAFEERYYASREVIKELRKQYIPFVKPLSELFYGGETLDIGCGRGEWLEIMNEMGFLSFGVDFDDGMLEACFEKNLSALKGDGVEYLKKVENESQVIISAFHVVEHISFADLQVIVKESFRALKPGGLLLLETPNPENIFVATNTFYLDPTHNRPIPPRLLSYLTEFYGFGKTKTLRLQEDKKLETCNNISLLNVISDVSQDYAVIGQKTESANESLLKATEEAFKTDYGLTLETLAQKYDQQNTDRLEKTEDLAREAEEISRQTLSRIEQAETTARQAEATARQLHDQLNTVYASTSWRLTRPFRTAKLSFSRSGALLKNAVKTVLIVLMKRVIVRPWLKRRIDAVLLRFPRLRQRLSQIAANAGIADPAQQFFHSDYLRAQGIYSDLENMSPIAKRVYFDLKKAMEQKRESKH